MIHKDEGAHHTSQAEWKNALDSHGFADGRIPGFDHKFNHN
jgi:hypothetical protein